MTLVNVKMTLVNVGMTLVNVKKTIRYISLIRIDTYH